MWLQSSGKGLCVALNVKHKILTKCFGVLGIFLSDCRYVMQEVMNVHLVLKFLDGGKSLFCLTVSGYLNRFLSTIQIILRCLVYDLYLSSIIS